MEQKDLARLVRDSQAGDPMARERLVRAVQDEIFFYCRTMLGDEDAAMDAAQDILVAMLSGLDRLREPEALRSWLRKIIVRICGKRMDRARRERQTCLELSGQLLEEGLLSNQLAPDAVLDQEETRQAITELVNALPTSQRLCVLLYYYDEMSVEEIAALLKVPAGTVKSRLYYARLAIKRGAEKYADEGLPLYGVSPLPFLRYFLRQDAVQGLEAAAASSLTQAALAGGTSGAVIGTAIKPALAALSGKKAAVVAGLALAGAITGGVLYQASRTPVQAPVQTPVQAAQPVEEPPVKQPAPVRQEPANPVPSEPPAPEKPVSPAAEPTVKPVPQSTHVTPPVSPAQPEEPPPEPQLPPEEPLILLSPDPDPPPEPVSPVTPDLDGEPEAPWPSQEPSPSMDWPQPISPIPPVTEDPAPESPPSRPVTRPSFPLQPLPPSEPPEPDPPPIVPEEPEEPVYDLISRTFQDSLGNGGYGYTSTLSAAWGSGLPPVEMTYSSSDPSIVSVNEKGEFTTLAPGDAVLTAVDPDNPAVHYELAVHVEDCFRWNYTLPDITLQEGQADLCALFLYNFSRLPNYAINVESVEWSSSDPSVALLLDNGSSVSCYLCAASPGTAAITGTVTFRLDTACGEMTMQDDVSFQVTVMAPPEEPTPEEPAPEGPEPEEPEDPIIYRKELASFGVNSGYGYQSSFAAEWGDALPEGLTYSSSDEAVAKISAETGDFYTVSAGTAELTAEDSGALYILTVHVQDQFQWTYTVSDLELNVREIKRHGLSEHTLPEEAWILGGSWSSSELGITFINRDWQACDICGVLPGDYTVTCVVNFDLMTFEGYVRMKTEFSFQVTVSEPEPEPIPDPEQPDDNGETL